MVPYILQLKFKSYIANDSACVSNPDLAGPAAKSEAEIKWNCKTIYLSKIKPTFLNLKYLQKSNI